MARYLLDTNVVSELCRSEPSQILVARIEKHRRDSCLGAPVWHELLLGCRLLEAGSKRRSTLEAFLSGVVALLPVLPYDERAADQHATERARLQKAGRTPTFGDGQIAAICQVNDLILVTRNAADFQGYSDLRIENWWRGGLAGQTSQSK